MRNQRTQIQERLLWSNVIVSFCLYPFLAIVKKDLSLVDPIVDSCVESVGICIELSKEVAGKLVGG